MINLITPKFNSTPGIQKREQIKHRPALGKDTVSFTRGLTTGYVSDMNYKNVLDVPLKSQQRATFSKDLRQVKLHHFPLAQTRISSLSRYLKEDMVGFVVPEYTVNGENKGGYQWFERGAEYLIRGSRRNVEEADFKPVAKELYGLLSLHDDYWKSQDFVDYLSTLKSSPAIRATISAVKELKDPKDVSFKGNNDVEVSMYGYFSPMKAMKKILNDGCAYSGMQMMFDNPKKSPRLNIRPERSASLEHIMPKSWEGPCDDANYLVTSSLANQKRGNMDLITYLKGSCASTDDANYKGSVIYRSRS